MTFSFYFYPEQLLLSFVKKSLRNQTPIRNENLGENAVCVFACVAAIESTLNSLLIKQGDILHFDEMGMRSKIETIAVIGKQDIDWGMKPWQDISQLIKVRHWLTHYKVDRNKSLGLEGGCGEWIKKPKINPLEEFSKESIEKYYIATKNALMILATGLNLEKEYKFLNDEDYTAFLAG